MSRTAYHWLGLAGMALLLSLCGTSNVQSGGEKPDPKPEVAKKLTTPEEIHEALGKKVDIHYAGQSLYEVLWHVSKKTGVPISVDQNSVGVVGMPGGWPQQPGVPGGINSVTLKIDNAPLGSGLSQFLQKYQLAPLVHGNRLVILHKHQALYEQMREPINLDITKVELAKALNDLAKKTGINIVLDGGENAQSMITLKLNGVALETAVRLIAYQGSLKSVRVDNVLVVGDAKKIALLPAENPLQPVTTPHFVEVTEQMAQQGIGQPGFPQPGFGPGPGFNPGIAPPPPMKVPPPPAILKQANGTVVVPK